MVLTTFRTGSRERVVSTRHFVALPEHRLLKRMIRRLGVKTWEIQLPRYTSESSTFGARGGRYYSPRNWRLSWEAGRTRLQIGTQIDGQVLRLEAIHDSG